MIETIKGLSQAQGFMMALAAEVSDRDVMEGKPGNTMRRAESMMVSIENAIDFIQGEEREIKKLRQEIKDWEDLHTDADAQAAIDAGR